MLYGKRGGSKKDITDKLRQMLLERDAGRDVMGERETLAHFLARWYKGVEKRGEVRPNTRAGYRRTVALFSGMDVGDIPLGKLKRADFQEAFDSLVSRYSPGTLRTRYQAISTALSYAVELELITTSPVAKVRLPKLERTKMNPLTGDELLRLERYAAGTRWAAFWVLMAECGLRVGEATALKWEDVNLKARRLSVVATLVVEPGELVISEPKSGVSRRVVPFGEYTADTLKNHRAMQQADQLRLQEYFRDHGLMACREDGVPIQRSVVYHKLHDHLAASGITKRSPHQLGHTFATLLFEDGKHPKLVQEWMGHSSIEQTLNTYSHVLPSMRDSAAETFDGLHAGRHILKGIDDE
jgi:integrase